MAEWLDVGLATRIKAGPPDEPPSMPDGDRYPKVLRDQREIYGITTVDEVRTFWLEFLARQAEHGVGPGVPFRDEQARSVVPFVNRGRWMALCPECGGGMICWDANPDTCCVDCGRVYEVDHQTPVVRAEVSRLLAARRTVNRNWDAHEGETIERLKVENVIYGAGSTVIADGLTVPESVTLPDDVVTIGEYLDRLRSEERKGR